MFPMVILPSKWLKLEIFGFVVVQWILPLSARPRIWTFLEQLLPSLHWPNLYSSFWNMTNRIFGTLLNSLFTIVWTALPLRLFAKQAISTRFVVFGTRSATHPDYCKNRKSGRIAELPWDSGEGGWHYGCSWWSRYGNGSWEGIPCPKVHVARSCSGWSIYDYSYADVG